MALQISGDAPTTKFIFRTVATPAAAKGQQRRSAAPSLALAGWRSVPHWNVPPAFEHPRVALMELGVEAYKEAVKLYYAGITEQGVERAQRTYSKWVVRQVLYAFESHIRGYRRQDVGRKGGALFHTASDELIHPQTLWDSGQLMGDLRGIIARYQVRGNLREATERLVKSKLKLLWGLK